MGFLKAGVASPCSVWVRGHPGGGCRGDAQCNGISPMPQHHLPPCPSINPSCPSITHMPQYHTPAMPQHHPPCPVSPLMPQYHPSCPSITPQCPSITSPCPIITPHAPVSPPVPQYNLPPCPNITPHAPVLAPMPQYHPQPYPSITPPMPQTAAEARAATAPRSRGWDGAPLPGSHWRAGPWVPVPCAVSTPGAFLHPQSPQNPLPPGRESRVGCCWASQWDEGMGRDPWKNRSGF